ncbi:Uncharacterised protein [Vibrio cholerae]|nr:Uncharacterised protein [Vibrio cholerae]
MTTSRMMKPKRWNLSKPKLCKRWVLPTHIWQKKSNPYPFR